MFTCQASPPSPATSDRSTLARQWGAPPPLLATEPDRSEAANTPFGWQKEAAKVGKRILWSAMVPGEPVGQRARPVGERVVIGERAKISLHPVATCNNVPTRILAPAGWTMGTT